MSARMLFRALLAGVGALAYGSFAGAEPFVGEIRWVAFNWAPQGWMKCDGQTLPIAENDVLFTLYGTTYGGDGQQTFNLPDVRGRVPMHYGQSPVGFNHGLGESSGQEYVTLTTSQMPAHAHSVYGVKELADAASPDAAYPARISTQTPSGRQANDIRAYRLNGTPAAMAPGMVGTAGGGQPHENMAPFTGLTCIVSLYGLFPSPP